MMNFKGTQCWEAVGPAGDARNKLCPHIKELLENNEELLEQGEEKPRGVCFNMWMEGKNPAKSQPIIVISSKSRRQRTRAKELLKQSQLLEEYPGIKIKALEKQPAIYSAGGQEENAVQGDTLNDIYIHNQSSDACGAPISFGGSRLATLMGVVMIGSVYYGLTAQHARFRRLEDVGCAPNKDEVLAFDDDSDDSDEDDAEITSKGNLLQ